MKDDIRASIDIGSNSVLLLVADVSHGKFREMLKRSEITSLGKELDKNKAFHPESMQATFEALKSYGEECDKFGISRGDIIATATEASRVALNSGEFYSKIESELGIKVQIITGAAEAYFTAKGILFNSKFDSEAITLMDIGGASTELIRINTKSMQIQETISMPIGSVRSTQWLSEGLFVQNLQKVFLDFRQEIDKYQTQELLCVAGTITSLANMHLKKREFVEEEVHNLKIKSEDVDVLFKKYADSSPEALLEEFPFLQKRSKTIRGGLHLVYHLVHRLMVKEITVSTYGLRYGTLLEGKIRKEFLNE
jgi:exopolyphosphatase/guanosine-5'-triphosphate,3'-diphosphate pyrophosphatase